MKKIISLALFLVLLAGISPAQDKFSLAISGNALWPSDGNFKTVYGKTFFQPEVRLTYALSEEFFLYGGYGFLSASGLTPIFQSDAQSTQHFFSIGGGYGASLGENLGFQIGAGIFLASYKETVADVSVTGSAIGFRADAALRYNISSKFFALAGLGYMTASDDVDGVSIKLGGLRAGLGFGCRF
jgi:hypothetical protein